MVNTLEIFEILKQADIEEPKARAIVKAIEKSEEKTREDMAKSLASKQDLAELKVDLIKTLVGWQLMAFIAQTTIILGGIYFMFSALRP